ncbi:MAG: hypothetical protein HRT87_09655, partial [Legionellales bacterium]|nr:hypothetical protein [Legionellales bacterium]
MRQIALTIILLILTNSIHADGIISNLDEYLQRYPHLIDEQGWVTITREHLLNNTKYFDINCDYKLVHSDTSIAFPIKLTKHRFVFKAPSADKDYLHLIEYNKKHKIIACWQKLTSREDSSIQVTAF